MKPAARRALARYRAALDAAEADPVRRITAYYLDSRNRIEREVNALLRVIFSSGISSSSDAFRLVQHRQLLKLIDDELAGLGVTVAPALSAAQRKAISAAIEQGKAFAAGQGVTIDDALLAVRQWVTIPEQTINGYIGSLRDGTPFRATLERLGPAIGQAVEQEIADGLVRSADTNDIAERIMRRTEVGYQRALTTAREAVFDSSRWAMEQLIAENSDILDGGQRIEVLDSLTCGVCWSLHGKTYRANEPFERHVRCRGLLMPLLIDGENLAIESGEAQLRRQPRQTQLNAFGGNKTAHQAWATGEIPLADFVKVHDSPYGPQTSMLGERGARRR